MRNDYDVVVIGARCAGSPLAMRLAQAGVRVLLIDRMTLGDDTLNGFLIKPAGVARLQAWGLLDAVLASGTPPVRSVRMVLGAMPVERNIVGNDVCPILAPRRFVLDRILVDSAASAGAELCVQTALDHLSIDNGRVVGARLLDRQGVAHDIRGRIVVGADGRGSKVARQAGARMQRADGSTSIAYWSYWTGITDTAATVRLGVGSAAGAAPTNEGEWIVWVQVPLERAANFRLDPGGEYLRILGETPVVSDLLAGARQVARMYGMLSLPNFYRVSMGSGWVLAGDAGHHKDPLVARGISDAFRDADLLATALITGLGATECELSRQLEAYSAARDAATTSVYEANLALSRLDWSMPQLGSLVARQMEAEAAADAAFAVSRPMLRPTAAEIVSCSANA